MSDNATVLQAPATRARELGDAMELLCETPHGSMPIALAYAHLAAAIALRQILFVRSEQGDPLGFVTWAYVSDEVLARLEAGDERPLALEEWNDGVRIWIVQMAARGSSLRDLVAFFRQCLPPQAVEIRGRRRRGRTHVVRLAIRPLSAAMHAVTQ